MSEISRNPTLALIEGVFELAGNLIGIAILIGVPVYVLLQLHSGLHGMADGLHTMAGAYR